jgi:hypothetical protein
MNNLRKIYNKNIIIIISVIINNCFPILRIETAKEGRNSIVRQEEKSVRCTILLYDTGKCGLMDSLKQNERLLSIEEKYVPKIFSYTSYLHSLFIITAPFIWIGNTTTLVEIKQSISIEREKEKK